MVASLAVLLQLALPLPCLFALPPGLDGICHAPADAGGKNAPQPLSDHACCHCLACQAGAAAFAPVTPVASRPGASWAVAAAAAPRPDHAPRGTSYRAYASRAPPVTG